MKVLYGLSVLFASLIAVAVVLVSVSEDELREDRILASLVIGVCWIIAILSLGNLDRLEKKS